MPQECPRLNDIGLEGTKLPSWRNRSTGHEIEGKNEERGLGFIAGGLAVGLAK